MFTKCIFSYGCIFWCPEVYQAPYLSISRLGAGVIPSVGSSTSSPASSSSTWSSSTPSLPLTSKICVLPRLPFSISIHMLCNHSRSMTKMAQKHKKLQQSSSYVWPTQFMKTIYLLIVFFCVVSNVVVLNHKSDWYDFLLCAV